jgi:hypothetical protein
VNETVDNSVWQRWHADPGYRSPSLVQALARAVLMLPVSPSLSADPDSDPVYVTQVPTATIVDAPPFDSNSP